MNRSPMKAAAISWVIACGLLCGGASMLSAAPAAADPGTGGDNHGGRGADSGSESNDSSRSGRPGGHRLGGLRKPDSAVVGDTHRHPGHIGDFPGGHWHPGDHDWPHPGQPQSGWPCLPFPHLPPIVLPPLPPLHWPRAAIGDGVGIAAPPRLSIAGRPPAPEVGGGGGSGGVTGVPQTVLPVQPGEPGEPPAVSAAGGTIAPATLQPSPITMPPLIGLPPAFGPPMRPLGPGSEPGPRSGPRQESTTTRERPPATSAGAGTEAPPSTRVGYPRYLQEAKMGEIAAVALPGFAGLLGLTALGGVFGYRQAKAGHVVRTAGTTRFMQ
ncbi:hypothetical protein [Mycolicibacterium sphagni]|nr:hypothetical protein [Mycolicibacterium sphagni]MCV7176854.1 hypothetical protein [Mycolicibacterium sphagni]